MTIDEAIKHCKEKQKELNEQACSEDMTEKEAADCLECATEHLQLATWLEELQEWRKLKNATTGEWIAIKYRPLTVKERIAFAEHYGVEYCDTLDEKAFDCPMPEDRQHILISTSWGVAEDFADNDIDGEGFIVYGLENNGDWDGVDAWQPMPEPYKKGGAE